jgi:lysophospholipase L1-like esterase
MRTSRAMQNRHIPMPSFRALAGAIPLVLAIFTFSCRTPQFAEAGNGSRWVGTWSTAPQLVEPGNVPPVPGLSGNTLRQIVRVSIGGDSLRVRFSNAFSTGPLTLAGVHIALSRGGGAIDPATDQTLSFSGMAATTIPPGSSVTSDALHFRVHPRGDVAITIHYGSSPADITGHPGSRTTSYLMNGDAVSKAECSGAVTTDHWYTINAIEVIPSAPSACVAILGNSITDGRGSVTNMQNRWPDVLSESLLADPGTRNVGVLNLGIGGNCVLHGGLGPTAVSRFDRDILGQEGVRWVIVFEGVNDIGGVRSAESAATTAAGLIDAYAQMIRKCHAKDIRVFGATILPFGGHSYFSAHSEQCRSIVNQWIRADGNFDGWIDFDRMMRDAADTTRLGCATYQNDGLHPDAAAYRKMGESIDRRPFAAGR